MLITLSPTLPISKNEPVDELHPIVTITLPNDELGLAEILNHLVKPALMAWGYAEQSVDKTIRPEFHGKTEHVNCPNCGYTPSKGIITGNTIDFAATPSTLCRSCCPAVGACEEQRHQPDCPFSYGDTSTCTCQTKGRGPR